MRFILALLLLIFPFSLRAEDEKNKLIVCENGLVMLDWDLEFIRHATQSIELTSFCGGKVLRQLLDAMEERLQKCPDIQVFILTSFTLLEVEDNAKIAHLTKTYPNNFHFLLSINEFAFFPDFVGIDNHAKCVIVDETYFSIGGTNLDEVLCTDGTFTPPRNRKGGIVGSHLPAGVRDMDVVGRGPFAIELRQAYHKLFALWENYRTTKKLKKDPETFAKNNHYFPMDLTSLPVVDRFESSDKRIEGLAIKFLFSGPHQAQNVISQEYEKLIDGAKEEIVIGNLYFNPTVGILKSATEAARRGVSITLITNGLFDDGPYYNTLCVWAHRIHYAPILYGKQFKNWEIKKASATPLCTTSIYEYHVPDILYHKKVMVIDRRITLIGTYNLGVKSDRGDYEWVIIVESPELAEDCLAVFEKDLSYCVPVDPKDALQWYFDPTINFVAKNQNKFHGFMNVPFEDEKEEDFQKALSKFLFEAR